MNYKLLVFSIFFLAVISQVSALQNGCSPAITLLSQDPYPAIPNDYVKIVFQVRGISSPSCGTFWIEPNLDFPFSLDEPNNSRVTLRTATYAGTDFADYLLVPYKVRVNANALDGENVFRVHYGLADTTFIKDFNITVEDARTDFEVSIRDYDSTANTLTFDILNSGENDVEALTVEISTQENFDVKGAKRYIVGSLDANEDTTFTFEGTPKKGMIGITLLYTDSINVRHSVEETVSFDPVYFEGRSASQSFSWSFYALIFLILLIFGNWARKKWFKKKQSKHN